MLYKIRLFGFFLLGFLFFISTSVAQNLGGIATYNFLKLATSPQVSALGGTVVAIQNDDVSVAQHNPALLLPQHHGILATNINFLYAGIKHMNVNYSQYKPKLNASFNVAVNFINYGKTDVTDDVGNINGSFNPSDYNVQLAFSKAYLQRWQYGVALKLIGSNYGQYKSFAAAIDVGATYYDSAHLLKAGVTFKNIGVQIKKYSGGVNEALPFDFQLGISKKLAKAPLQFIVSATNVHQFDIRYADTSFENEINGTVQRGKFTFDKLFRHFIFAAQIYPSKQLEFTIGYNYLRRRELNLFNIGNGINGFSVGAGLLFNAYQIRLAKAYYQNTKAYNQIGININLEKLHR
jgi:hypothetical protein